MLGDMETSAGEDVFVDVVTQLSGKLEQDRVSHRGSIG